MSFFQNTCKPRGTGGRLMVSLMNIGHAAMAEWGFSQIALPGDAACLDIGCGGGANIRKLLARCPDGRVTGIDHSEISVAKSRRLNQAAVKDRRCQVLQADVMALPFSHGTFDCVTAFETVYFWPDSTAAFRQVCRVLKASGTLMICNESDGENASDAKWTKRIQGMTIYTADQLRKSLSDAGFTEIHIHRHPKGWLCAVCHKAPL